MRRSPITLISALAAAYVVLALTGCGAEITGPDAPDVTGMTLDEARTAITAAGLGVGNVDYDPESTEATWTVTSQATERFATKSDVVHLVLAGGEPVKVPEVVGTPFAQAIVVLEQEGLAGQVVEEVYSDEVPESSVISQEPAPGSAAPEGSTVTMVVSKGPTPPPSSSLKLHLADKITGGLSPKSVVASPRGLVFAQNMMYLHTIGVYDADKRERIRTISDTVTLSDWGFSEWTKPVKGAPVEAAVSADGSAVYVSNYSMYGPGFSKPGSDTAGPSAGVDDSFVYRIPFDTLEIDQVIRVGAVPKYLATTPDGRYLLVSNWTSFDLSVIDVTTGTEVKRIDIGRYPRGIAVTSDSKYAYVAGMGTNYVVKVDLGTFKTERITVGTTPRHIVLSPDNRFLYITLNVANKIVKFDLESEKVVDSVSTGNQPRSMAIAPDGESLYVVNYLSNTVSKVRTADMKEIQREPVADKPIGITYLPDRNEVWACCYSGVIYVFEDR